MYCGGKKVAGKIDKLRNPIEGVRTFIGTGVAPRSEMIGQKKDLAQFVQEIVGDMLNGAIANMDSSLANEIINSILASLTSSGIFSRSTVINQMINTDEYVTFDDLGMQIKPDMWEAVQIDLGFLLNSLWTLKTEMHTRLRDLQQQIWDLQSGLASGSGVTMFQYYTRHGTSGMYNCRELQWGVSSDVAQWTYPYGTDTKVCKNILETTGNGWVYYESTVFFMTVGKHAGISTDDIFPVIPIRSTKQKAYVKTTPGATTTLVCYLGKDINGSPTPTEINVECVIDGGGYLNACVPSVVGGDYIWAQNVLGTWVNVTPFIAVEQCEE